MHAFKMQCQGIPQAFGANFFMDMEKELYLIPYSHTDGRVWEPGQLIIEMVMEQLNGTSVLKEDLGVFIQALAKGLQILFVMSKFVKQAVQVLDIYLKLGSNGSHFHLGNCPHWIFY